MKFDEYCGRLAFAADMNGDGQITISDVTEWVKYILFAPAKFAMALIDQMPPLRGFFETDCHTGLSFGGFAFSAFVWLIVLVILALSME
jgi:hypothetical protein